MNEAKQKQLDAYQTELKDSQNELVIAYMPALRALAFRLKSRLPNSVDPNDLISVGATEMVRLSRSYDKEKNDNFWGYARQRIHGSMLDYLRGLDVLSRGDRRLVRLINDEIDKYFLQNESEPDNAYLARILGEDEQKIADARSLGEISMVLPIDDQIQLFSQSDTQEQVEKDELIQKISAVLKTFSERDRLVIQLYYFEELNLKEISEIMKITESRISQIHKKLIIKIRERLGING